MAFTVSSIMTTNGGFCTVDFTSGRCFSKCLLVLLMIFWSLFGFRGGSIKSSPRRTPALKQPGATFARLSRSVFSVHHGRPALVDEDSIQGYLTLATSRCTLLIAAFSMPLDRCERILPWKPM